MALDAATLALTAGELKQTLTDAKIAKIFEPTRDELCPQRIAGHQDGLCEIAFFSADVGCCHNHSPFCL